jgi:HAD superfamily hydrolase (TIGR01509 family)
MTELNLNDYDAVAFDVEGTLADTIPTHHASRLRSFAQHGYGHITSEQHALGSTYGSSTADIVGGILHAAGAIKKEEPFKTHPIVQKVMETKNQYFREIADKGFEAMPGAIEFVNRIEAHFHGHMALVTSSPERFVLPFIKRYGLADFFPGDLIISEDTILAENMEGKPAPDPYLLAMKRLGAKKLLVFEDTIPGTMSAKRAGATVVALGFDVHSARLFASKGLEYPPDIFVKDYEAAQDLLGMKVK